MVRNPWTALIAVSIVLMQTAIAFGMGQLGFGYWWVSLLIAFCVGAFGNHANYCVWQSCELRHHSRCYTQPDFPEPELE